MNPPLLQRGYFKSVFFYGHYSDLFFETQTRHQKQEKLKH